MFEYAHVDIVLTWGPITFSGFMDGSFVMGERDEDGVAKHAGAQGDITATLNSNLAGFFTVQLVQGSPVNAALFAIQATQDRTRKLQRKAMELKDLAGTLLVSAPNAWIRKAAKAEFAKEVVGREWIFDCDKLIYTSPQVLR